MARVKTIKENPETGWSDWITPKMSGYRMICCDCGLSHNLEFETFRANDLGNGYHEVTEDLISDGRVRLRAQRNNRSTAQIRRHKDKMNEEG